MDWHKELERSLGGQGDASLYDPAQYSAQLLQVKSPSCTLSHRVTTCKRFGDQFETCSEQLERFHMSHPKTTVEYCEIQRNSRK